MEQAIIGLPGYVRLLRRGGRDLVATRAERAWWEFEDPLPLAVAALCDLTEGAFYDVGANTGFYSVLVGRLRPDLVVRAFEPAPDIAALCRENLDLNGVAVDLRPVALSDRDESAQLFFPPDDHGLIESSASLDQTFKESVTHSIEVECRRLDGVNAELGGERIGLVKIDVEGAEQRVLDGARVTAGRDRPLIAVELLPRADFRALDTWVADLGYVLVSLRAGLDHRVEPAAGFLPDSWNQLLVPAERLDSVRGVLDEARGALADHDAGTPSTTTPVEQLLLDQVRLERRAADAELEAASAVAAAAEHREAEARADRDALRTSLTTELDALRAALDTAERRVDELQASTSWKVTAPLRRATDLVRSRRGGASPTER